DWIYKTIVTSLKFSANYIIPFIDCILSNSGIGDDYTSQLVSKKCDKIRRLFFKFVHIDRQKPITV
ncbi:MAG: hypothetical protein M5Z89_03655, partial [Olivibacter sp.]|nr:hypothetical protein [Olivibacter sp. UJ_SKK_5.1]